LLNSSRVNNPDEEHTAMPTQSALQIDDREALTEAFGLFNQLSEQLTSAYGQLESRVSELNAELIQARQARLRELAEKERLADRLSGLLKALPAAVVLVDGRDRVDQFNPAAEELFPGIAWGRRWSEVRDETLARLADGEEWRLADGRRVNMRCRPLNDNGQVLVMLDVTETRRLQEALHRRERLSAMGEMAAQLAHQVRTPLSAALLYGGQLARGAVSADKVREYAGKLCDRLRHTESLVADMLAFARGGCFVPQPVDLQRALQEAADMVRPKLPVRQAELDVQVDVDGEACILGNRDALTGALGALINNALDHGGEGIRIQAFLRQRDDHFEIGICDNGPGIPEALQQRIFDPFFTTGEQGTGLGLAVAQSVVMEHDGRIEYQTGTEGGACFRITLPRVNATNNQSGEQ
jgi:two-component system sensor histidine kinase FlrB